MLCVYCVCGVWVGECCVSGSVVGGVGGGQVKVGVCLS